MSETKNNSKPRKYLKSIMVFLLHPQQEYKLQAEQKKSMWLTPMLLLSLTMIICVLISGILRARAAAMGDVNLPVDWQWWTTEMQNNYMQAVQATQGPVFLYIIPSITGLAGLWLGWGILSGLLHLGSTLLGGRGTLSSALNITAWSSLPFTLRDLLRVIYMLIAGHPVNSAGLSGFVTGTEGGALFIANLLKYVDLFLVWQILLLILGFSILDSLPRNKAIAGVLIIILISLLAQAGLGALGSSLGGLIVTRPFF